MAKQRTVGARARSRDLPVEQYRAIVESAAVMIRRSDTQANANYLNDAWQRFTGRDVGSDLGHSWVGAVHPEDRESCVATFAVHGRDQLPYEMQYRIRRDDGEYRWCLDRAVPFTDENGTFAGFVATIIDIHEQRVASEHEFRDVTEQRQLQLSLEYQAHVQRAITENAVSGLLLVDDRGHTTYMNPAAQEVLGFTVDEISRLTLHDAVHHSRPDGTPIAQEQCQYYQAFLQGQAVRNAHEWLIRKDGSFFPASVAATPLFRGGKLAGAVYEFHDIAEQHRAWEALREADRRKDQFLAILGHELRNPIGTIKNAMGVIARRPAPDSETERMREIVLRQSEHLHRLVDELLDVARIQTGKIALSRARVDVRDVARSVVDAARTGDKLARHEVSLTMPAEPVVVEGDRARLEQLVGNFLDNAVKFTPGDRAIRVSVDGAEGRAVVAVADEGRGIAGEELSRLFRLFAQVDEPLDRPNGGLGVGLALARAIAELHGGSVGAQSPGPGKGSTFTLTLPLAVSAPAAEPSSTSDARATARRVFIVEDNGDARAALAALLVEEGHDVTAFAGGRDAVARVAELRPDIVFIDLGLPEMDGFAVARALRANGAKHVRLVALTGYGQPQDVKLALEAGFDAHLTKPASIEQLNAAIAAA
jgi:PAS domain S-box-containing protein